jgi:hypothetical protein
VSRSATRRRECLRPACIASANVVNSLCAAGDSRTNLCGVRETAMLLTNRWSTRWEPIARSGLASPPFGSGIQKPALRRPLVNCGFSKAPTRHRWRFFPARSRPRRPSRSRLASVGVRGRPVTQKRANYLHGRHFFPRGKFGSISQEQIIDFLLNGYGVSSYGRDK